MPPDPLIGSDLGGFAVLALIGRGGMSRVYRAEQRRLGRTVALKVLSPDLAEDPVFRERFLRETQVAMTLEHPNVLPVYDAGEEGGRLFIAMRLVEGSEIDLAALLEREGRLAPERALGILGQVASALDAAHERGLVHRDVKPGNVLLSGEHAYLTDFGIAKPIAARREFTRTGVFVGTLDYASPEQIRNAELGAASDVYALGCLLFHCLTGHPPFDRPSEFEVMQAHLQEPPPSASAERPELPAAIDAVIAQAMAKDPDLRYRSGRKLVEAARAAMEERRAAAPTIAPTVIAAVPRVAPTVIERGRVADSQAPVVPAQRQEATPPGSIRGALLLSGLVQLYAMMILVLQGPLARANPPLYYTLISSWDAAWVVSLLLAALGFAYTSRVPGIAVLTAFLTFAAAGWLSLFPHLPDETRRGYVFAEQLSGLSLLIGVGLLAALSQTATGPRVLAVLGVGPWIVVLGWIDGLYGLPLLPNAVTVLHVAGSGALAGGLAWAAHAPMTVSPTALWADAP